MDRIDNFAERTMQATALTQPCERKPQAQREQRCYPCQTNPAIAERRARRQSRGFGRLGVMSLLSRGNLIYPVRGKFHYSLRAHP